MKELYKLIKSLQKIVGPTVALHCYLDQPESLHLKVTRLDGGSLEVFNTYFTQQVIENAVDSESMIEVFLNEIKESFKEK